MEKAHWKIIQYDVYVECPNCGKCYTEELDSEPYQDREIECAICGEPFKLM